LHVVRIRERGISQTDASVEPRKKPASASGSAYVPARGIFTTATSWVAAAAGKPAAFVVAAAGIVVWALSGPLFAFSDTWQLIVNTTTTIITFLMVFVIQNSQNRDTAALQIKLDELIRVSTKAEDRLLDLEELPVDELERIRQQFEELAQDARAGDPKPQSPA
jgi:low affinity Fe/Cu permease